MYKSVGGLPPTKDNKYSPYSKLYAKNTNIIPKGDYLEIFIGVALDINYKYGSDENFKITTYFKIEICYEKSKLGLIANSKNINSDSTEEFSIVIYNGSQNDITISSGEYIADVLILPHNTYYLDL